MLHTYKIEGITCGGCQAGATRSLEQLSEVKKVYTDKDLQKIQIDTEQPLSLGQLNKAFEPAYKYKLSEYSYDPLEFWSDWKQWKRASANTLNCLIGCSLGDFAMIIFLQTYYPQMSMFLMMGLAIISGLVTSVVLETILLRIKEKLSWELAVVTAFRMSFLSMVVMELAENITDFSLTGGTVTTSQPFYWVALGIALIAGFFVPLPYNYYKLKKLGKSCH